MIDAMFIHKLIFLGRGNLSYRSLEMPIKID